LTGHLLVGNWEIIQLFFFFNISNPRFYFLMVLFERGTSINGTNNLSRHFQNIPGRKLTRNVRILFRMKDAITCLADFVRIGCVFSKHSMTRTHVNQCPHWLRVLEFLFIRFHFPYPFSVHLLRENALQRILKAGTAKGDASPIHFQ